MKLFALLTLASLVALSSCESSKSGSTETKKVDIYFEESFKPLFISSIDTYQSQRAMGDIEATFLPENDVIKGILNRTVSTICITRELNKEELAALKKKNIEVRTDKIAKDAVTLIVHPENPDSLLTVDELKEILQGKKTTWENGSKINIVFDNENSANFNYLKKLAGIETVPSNVYAVKTNEEVINHVKANKSSIGVIGVNWISDEDDPQALSFRKGLKVVSVAQKAGDYYFKPYQSYIYTDEYPLTREVFMINYAGRSTTNSDFVNFMVGEKGQLIIQKSSLIPVNMHARMIEIKTE